MWILLPNIVEEDKVEVLFLKVIKNDYSFLWVLDVYKGCSNRIKLVKGDQLMERDSCHWLLNKMQFIK